MPGRLDSFKLESISGKHVQLVSGNFKGLGISKLVSYLKYRNFCLHHVHDVRRRELEIPVGLALNVTIINQTLDASRSNNDLTFVTERSNGRRQRLFCNCTFDIESIPICDGGTPVHMTKATLDHIEVTVHKDDSSGVPNSKQPETSWHLQVVCCQL